MLKADFHIHTGDDPVDFWIDYSSKELIDLAASKGFDVISITNHSAVTYNDELFDYAKKKGILLISGVEARVENCDVIILNASLDAGNIKTFSELEKFKKKNPKSFIFAPHPFYPMRIALHRNFFKHISLFEGVEYSHCYLRFVNPFNRLASRYAVKYNLPLIGTSDAHQLFQFGTTYSLIDAKDKSIDSIISALKKGNVEVKSRPLSFVEFVKVFLPMIKRRLFWKRH